MRKIIFSLCCTAVIGLYSCQEETPEQIKKSDPKTEGIRTVIDLNGSPAHVRDMGDHYLFQGDIMIDKESLNEKTQARTEGASMDGRRWPDHIVYYKVSSSIDTWQQTAITNSVNSIAAESNLEFVKLTSPGIGDDYIDVIPAPSGAEYAGKSYLGKKGGRQELELRGDAGVGTIIHEFLHAVGILHEHNREDRDDYVIINHSEIPSSLEDQYDKYSDGFDHGPFDFLSVMIYQSLDRDNDEIYDMVKKSDGSQIGDNRQLSPGDIALLDQLYRPIVHSGGSVSTDTRFYFADVNGDGRADKIYWQFDKHDGDIRVALATYGGNFAPYVHSSGSESSSTKFYFADVNGDGKADKIYWKYDKYGGDVRVALATTGGAFGSYVQSGGSGDSPTNFYFADINGDGKADKIYWNSGNHSGDVRVALATTGGNFASYVHSGGSADATTRFFFGDINGDGKFDKVYWNFNNHGGDIRTALSTTGGAFATYVHSSGSSSLSTQFYFADVNGDDLYDKVYWKYDAYGGDVRPFISNSGIFNTPALQTAGSDGVNTKMYFADVDGDGKADRISWNNGTHGGDIRVFLADEVIPES